MEVMRTRVVQPSGEERARVGAAPDPDFDVRAATMKERLRRLAETCGSRDGLLSHMTGVSTADVRRLRGSAS